MLEIGLAGPLKNNDSMEEVPDWSKADLLKLREAIQEVDWASEFENMSGTQSMEKFYSVLDREVDKFVPKKMRRKGNKPLWMNKNIIRMIRKKRRLWRSYSTDERSKRDYASFQAFKNIQKEVQKAVKKAKRKLERSLAKNAKKNPKAFYSYIKKKTSNKVTVGPLKTPDGKLVTDDKEMADILNRHYCNMFTKEKIGTMEMILCPQSASQKKTSVQSSTS